MKGVTGWDQSFLIFSPQNAISFLFFFLSPAVRSLVLFS